MIIGLGCDTVNIKRLEKPSEADYARRLAQKILSPAEIQELTAKQLPNDREYNCRLAKYYAAKEAFTKALGTGFRDGIHLHDIEVYHDELGKPLLKISGAAAAYLQKLTPSARIHLTLSDDYPYAQAVVIIED